MADGLTRPRRIAYIAPHIQPAHTGGEQYNLHLVQAAEDIGYEVRRIALLDNAVYRRLVGLNFVWRVSGLFGWFWFHFQIIRFRHYLLLFDAWSAPVLWPGVWMIRRRYRVVVHHLCHELEKSFLSKKWRRFCERALLRQAEGILTVSRCSRSQIETLIGKSENIAVINAAFERVKGATRGGGNVVRLLFVGHITRAKGVIDLVHAVARLPADMPWHLDLVGRDTVELETTEAIRQFIHENRLAYRITMHGRLDDDALLEMYLSSDIFVLPSYWEGYGIVLLEAMSHGLAVVSTTAGAIPEVVRNHETGILVSPGDVDTLTDTIAHLIRKPSLREFLARNGRAFATAHPDWNDMRKQCVKWWKETPCR